MILAYAARVILCLVDFSFNIPLSKITIFAVISISIMFNYEIPNSSFGRNAKNANLQIGNVFGLNHFSESWRVTIIINKLTLEQNFGKRIKALNH